MRVLFLLFLTALLAPAQEEEHKAKPVAAELEGEAAHNNSYGYFRAGLEFKKVSVEVRGYRQEEGEKIAHQAHMALGTAIPLPTEYVKLVPQLALVVGENGRRGIAPGLKIQGHYKRLSTQVLLLRNFSLKENPGYFWMYPWWTELRLTRRLSAVSALELGYSSGKLFTEKGGGLALKHGNGQWIAYYMTCVQEKPGAIEEIRGREILPLATRRFHTVRFGRTFEFGGKE